MPRSYYRVMLGAGSMFAAECFAGNFIGTDFDFKQDLTGKFTDDWRAFNQEFIPVYLQAHPDKTRIGAGLACGATWTVGWGLKSGDMVLSPDGSGHYHVAEVTGDYHHVPDGVLPHRRPVHWLNQVVDRSAMSQALKNSTGSVGTIANVTIYADEIEKLLGGISGPVVVVTDETVEDPLAFAMEKHLEDFLVANWPQTELGKEYDIYEDEGLRVGQQYPSDTGPIDVLAVSKDKKTLLVVELKRGRANVVALRICPRQLLSEFVHKARFVMLSFHGRKGPRHFESEGTDALASDRRSRSREMVGG